MIWATKVLKCTFKNFNQKVLGTLQKFVKGKIKDFMPTFFTIPNKKPQNNAIGCQSFRNKRLKVNF